MILLYPTFFPIPNCKDVQHRRFKLPSFIRSKFTAVKYLIKRGSHFCIRIIIRINVLKAMIRNPAYADGFERSAERQGGISAT